MPASIQDLTASLAVHGLRLRGSFAPQAQDGLAPLQDGMASRLYLVGVAGSDFWPYFKASPQFQDGAPDPLDRWSRAIAEKLAQQWGGKALFPFEGPPYHPFQRWADRCEPTQSSRMMLRMHPEFGLWHAYRFALLLPASTFTQPAIANASVLPSMDVCLQCDGQPCLKACPVSAYTGESFAVDACRGHLGTSKGQVCMQGGCLARNACPQGRSYAYQTEHAAFHMRAFFPAAGTADRKP